MEKRTGLTELQKILPQQSVPLTTLLSEASEFLTEEEIELALTVGLKSAIHEKKAAEARRKYWELVNKPYEAPELNWKDLMRIIIKKANESVNGFKLSLAEAKIYILLAKYFTNDKSVEKFGLSLKKGLLVFGNIGCGKTTAMKLFQLNPKQSYGMFSCRKVADEFTEVGVEALMKYSGMIPVSPPSMYYGQKMIGICYDDLGTETSSKFFGNERNVMSEIILNRYDVEIRSSFNIHITTNLTGDQIEEYYGKRVRSRMREMFNVIRFPESSKDKRK